MRNFLKEGKCPRLFSLSFGCHSFYILSFDTHLMSEMTMEWFSIIPHLVLYYSDVIPSLQCHSIIQRSFQCHSFIMLSFHYFTLLLMSFHHSGIILALLQSFHRHSRHSTDILAFQYHLIHFPSFCDPPIPLPQSSGSFPANSRQVRLGYSLDPGMTFFVIRRSF